ncbi:MAG: hypothetical protein DHS20C06_08090 [Hyphobacterium sp.]|nr:MAG: hypothetical protein DHS20C06_08090 [Hyphobacterium sp.]
MKAYRLIGVSGSAAFVRVRRHLIWKNIAFTETAADRNILNDEVKTRMRHATLPLLITPDNRTLSNETAIIDALNERHTEPDLLPDTPVGRYANRLIEAFSVKWLSPAVQSIGLNTSRDRFAQDLRDSVWPNGREEDDGALVKRLVRQSEYRLTRTGFDPTRPETTQATMTAFLDALEHRLERGSFLFGDHPKSADIALSAPLSLLPFGAGVAANMAVRFPGIQRWLMQMMEPPARRPSGDRNPSTVPESATALLRFAAQAFLPPARQTAEALSDWVETNPGQINLPRNFGLGQTNDDHDRQIELTPDYYWLMQGLVATIQPDFRTADTAVIARLGAGDPTRWTLPREARYENHKFRVNLVPNHVDDSEIALPSLQDNLHQIIENTRETRNLDALVA